MKELSDSHVRQHLLTSWWLISFPTYFFKQLWETTRIRVQTISCHCKAPSPILVREQFNQCDLDWMESERWAGNGLCNQMTEDFNFNVLNFSYEMHGIQREPFTLGGKLPHRNTMYKIQCLRTAIILQRADITVHKPHILTGCECA